MLRRAPRYGEPEFRRFLRHYQRMVLRHGKRRALEVLERDWPPVGLPEGAPQPA